MDDVKASRSEALAAMSPARQARTVVAAGNELSWQVADTVVVAPYVDDGGNPILIVDRVAARCLLQVGWVTAEMGAAWGLGSVQLVGRVERAELEALDEAGQELLRLRHETSGLVVPLEQLLLLRVAVDRVRIASGESESYARVPLVDYAEAEADCVVADGWMVAQHLNTDHAAQVVDLAARLSGRRPGDIVAASIGWIDRDGLDLVVIDISGATEVRTVFDTSITCIAQLGEQLQILMGPGCDS